MARTGLEKWEKYFKGKEVKTKIANDTKVFDNLGKPIIYLKQGMDIIVLESKKYDEYKRGGRIFGLISYDNKNGLVSWSDIAKPISLTSGGATEVLRIKTEGFLSGGKKEMFDFGGRKVSVVSFSDVKKLDMSVMNYLKTHPNVRNEKEILDTIEKYIKGSNPYELNWKQGIEPGAMNELGKYYGEVLIGRLALMGKTNSFQPNIFGSKKVAKICAPLDPSFSGVDSFVVMKDNSIIPISSKLGVGAKASFFSNFLSSALKHEKNVGNNTLKEFIKAANTQHVTSEMLTAKKGSKQVLYEWGCNHLLKLKIKNPYKVFESLKSGKLDSDTTKVLSTIKNYKGIDQKVKALLPKSVTAFFCREAAKQFNTDKKAIDDMKKILVGKDFYQANLQVHQWKEGKIVFKILRSSEANVKVIGDKAAIGDINAEQGMINYELRY